MGLVIQQHHDTLAIYRDYLADHPAGGLQHVAAWVDDIADTVTGLEDAGRRDPVRQRYGNGHANLDADDVPEVMIQLMARSERLAGCRKTHTARLNTGILPHPAGGVDGDDPRCIYLDGTA